MTFFYAVVAFSGTPTFTTFQTRIVAPGNIPLEAASVNFRFTILDSAGTCVLYIEDYNGVNMVSSMGLASFSLGSGSKQYPAGGVSLYEVFNNATPSFPCQAGGTFSPGATDRRQIVMQFNDGSGWQTLPQMAINSVFYANYANRAESLGDYVSTDYLRPATLPTCSGTQALTFDGTAFTCVAASGGGGGVSSVTGTAPISVASGTSTPVISIAKATAAASGYLSSADWTTFNAKANSVVGAGKLYLGNASGDATGVTLSGDATLANTGVMTLANSGVTAGTYGSVNAVPSFTIDAKGRVTNATSSAYQYASAVDKGVVQIGSNITLNSGVISVLSSDITNALGFTPMNSAAAGFLNGGNAFSADATLGATSNFGLGFLTNNITRMSITNGGNVGIGTGTPRSAFHVTAPATATANYGLVSVGSGPFDGSSAGKFVGSASGTELAINAPSGYAGDLLNFQTAGTKSMTLDTSGNLHVYGNNSALISDGGLKVMMNSSDLLVDAGYTGYGTRIYSGYANVVGLTVSGVAGQTADLFNVKNANGSIVTTIDKNGNVSLGTSTPVDRLSFPASALSASATHAMINLSNTALSGGNTAGTYIGANPSTSGPDFINFQINGNSVFGVSDVGRLTGSGPIFQPWGTDTYISSGTSTGNGAQPRGYFDGGNLTLLNYGYGGYSDINFSIFNANSVGQHAYIATVPTAGASNYSPSLVFGTSDTATAYSEKMRMDPSGNVGIGTTTPGSKLTVVGDINITGNYKVNGANIGGGSALSAVTAATAGNTLANAANTQNWNWKLTSNTAGMSFGETTASTGGTGTQSLVKISNLASSTAVPLTIVSNGAQNQALSVSATSGGYGISASSLFLPAVYGTASNSPGIYGVTTSTASSDSGVAGMAFNNGIGVYGQSAGGMSGLFQAYGSTNSAPTLVTMQNTTSTADLFQAQNSSGTSLVNITSAGKVGIGISTPQTTLQVAGVISPATNNTYTLGNATYRFTEVYATNGVINTSDAREKKDVYDTDLGLIFINKLRPVSYRWNTGVDNDVHYGLIAQEAEQVITEVGKTDKTSIVTHDEKTDRYGVRYSELISPIIKAVQQLYNEIISIKAQKADQAEVEQLKADSALKDQKIKELELRLERIEKSIEPK